MRKILCIGMTALICLSLMSGAALAAPLETPGSAIKPQLVQVAPKLMGQLFMPDESSELKHIGILVMHPNSDFFDHPTTVALAERGFTVLVSNTRYTNHGEDIFWENAVIDMKTAFDYFKALPGIEKVILIGHSGGGPLAIFYQYIAENGVKAGQGPEKIYPISDALEGLSKADGLILLDSHLGYGFTSLITKDPSVVAEGPLGPGKIDDKFNIYLEENGLSAQGANYSAEWKKNFYAAQADRNERILAYALGRLEAIEKGEGTYPDNEPIVVPRNYARLFGTDLTELSHTKGKYPILTVNGIKEDVARSIRSQGINKWGEISGASDNLSFSDGTLMTNIRNYLSSYSVRAESGFHLTEDDIIGVDFASSNTSAPSNLEGVRVPVLLMGMTAHYFVVPSEVNYNHTAASDKTLVFVEGASHGLLPSKPEFGDTLGMIADYARDWIVERFK